MQNFHLDWDLFCQKVIGRKLTDIQLLKFAGNTKKIFAKGDIGKIYIIFFFF